MDEALMMGVADPSLRHEEKPMTDPAWMSDRS
jgi:amidase